MLLRNTGIASKRMRYARREVLIERDESYQHAQLNRKSLTTFFVGLGQVLLIQFYNEGPLNQNESNEDKISKVKSVFESGSQTERERKLNKISNRVSPEWPCLVG